MFSAWGRFVYRRRLAVALLAVLAPLIALPLAGRASDVLTSGGWLVEGSESAAVRDRLASEFDAGRSSLIVIYRTAGEDAPATMRLMGDWNWWAPGRLRRLADRLGFSHVEDEESARRPTEPAAQRA